MIVAGPPVVGVAIPSRSLLRLLGFKAVESFTFVDGGRVVATFSSTAFFLAGELGSARFTRHAAFASLAEDG